MKKNINPILFIGIMLMLVSCSTTGNSVESQRGVQSNPNRRVLNPEEICGIMFVNGENVAGGRLGGGNIDDRYQLLVNENGTFNYTKNGNAYTGTWSFNINERLYRYIFEWVEDGNKQGYIMDFMKDNDYVIWTGRWFATDAYKGLSVRFQENVE
jgi:hypothetical protein